MKYRIAAYITFYKDISSFKTCVSSINNQSYEVNIIYVVNNCRYIIQDKLINVLINNQPDNIGVAGGFSLALAWAIDHHYDFLWTFDQDSKLSSDTLSVLISEYEYLKSNVVPIGIIAPSIVDSQTNSLLPSDLQRKYRIKSYYSGLLTSPFHYFKDKLYECDIVITSGSLICLQAAKKIPRPNPDLFIDGVDWEYCLNMRKHGYHICVTEKTTLQHNFGTFLTHFNKDFPIYIYSPLRYYYMNRNHTYIETRLSTHPYYKTLSTLHRIKVLIKKIIKIIIYEPNQKSLKIWAACLGFYHGIIGKLGKSWSDPIN